MDDADDDDYDRGIDRRNLDRDLQSIEQQAYRIALDDSKHVNAQLGFDRGYKVGFIIGKLETEVDELLAFIRSIPVQPSISCDHDVVLTEADRLLDELKSTSSRIQTLKAECINTVESGVEVDVPTMQDRLISALLEISERVRVIQDMQTKRNL